MILGHHRCYFCLLLQQIFPLARGTCTASLLIFDCNCLYISTDSSWEAPDWRLSPTAPQSISVSRQTVFSLWYYWPLNHTPFWMRSHYISPRPEFPTFCSCDNWSPKFLFICFVFLLANGGWSLWSPYLDIVDCLRTPALEVQNIYSPLDFVCVLSQSNGDSLCHI